MRMQRSQWLLVMLMSAWLSTPVAYARQSQDEKDQSIDKARAAEQARKEVNGRVLKVDRGQDKYRVKVLKKNGRVVSVDVDRRSGQVEGNEDKGNKR